MLKCRISLNFILQDLSKQHPRSKSETAELRTVSPRFSSGKSNHSMSGGFGNY